GVAFAGEVSLRQRWATGGFVCRWLLPLGAGRRFGRGAFVYRFRFFIASSRRRSFRAQRAADHRVVQAQAGQDFAGVLQALAQEAGERIGGYGFAAEVSLVLIAAEPARGGQ